MKLTLTGLRVPVCRKLTLFGVAVSSAMVTSNPDLVAFNQPHTLLAHTRVGRDRLAVALLAPITG